MQEIQKTIQTVVKDLFNIDESIDLVRCEEQFGDYSTNIALKLGKSLGKNPKEIAQQITTHLTQGEITKAEVAGPGFINLTVRDSFLVKLTEAETEKPLQGQVIVTEYSDPNPFKVLHAGHLYTSIVGTAISNLLEQAGGTVHRVNFGGDVGLHVARAMWGILQNLGGENPAKLDSISEVERPDWMAARYVEGSEAYDNQPNAKEEIIALNTRVYEIHQKNDTTSPFAKIYWTCRTWSYDYFDTFYAKIGCTFEKYYPESETAQLGLDTVRAHIGDTYEESNGAVVFNGEKYGLHTRVFINSNGLPTYEAKDVGLAIKKWQDYKFDKSVIITGNDIAEYMKVVIKSLQQFAPETTDRTTHLTHGQVKLAGGVKMSSRKGNFLRAVDVLESAALANTEANGKEDEAVSQGAVKYAFLKQRIGGDIIYDPKESVSLHGNSGPYLQYAHARARSILAKLPKQAAALTENPFEPGERSLLRKLSEYNEVVNQATTELMPHHVCIYLYELSQVFNRFYEQNKVVGNTRQVERIALVQHYAETLESGLLLLGISAPDTM